MLRWLPAVALLLSAPLAQACVPAADTDGMDMEARMELRFEHGDCARSNLDACPKLPDADAPLVMEGVLVWSSQTDKACSIGAPSVDPVTVNLEGVVRAYAGWLDLQADPSEILIPVTDQYTAPGGVPDPNEPLQHGVREYPVTVTISLVGEPSEEALQSLENTGGAIPLFVKARMGATAAYTAQFTMETFNLDGRSVLEEASRDAAKDVPATPAFLILVALGLAAVLRRKA